MGIPHDGEVAGLQATASVEVLNSPPVVTVDLLPAAPVTTDHLIATPLVVDDDGDAVTLSYTWEQDGTTVWLPSDTAWAWMTAKTEIWTVTIEPTDDEETGASSTASVTVLNSAPVVESVTMRNLDRAGVLYTNDELLAEYDVVDHDGDAVTIGLSWTVDGTEVSTAGSLSGATDFDRGHEVGLTVTASDADLDAIPGSADPQTVADSPPTAATVEMSQPTYDTTEDLICLLSAPGADADGDAVSYDFSWSVDGSAYTGASTTTESGDTVPASDTSVPENWTCSVTTSANGLQAPAESVSALIGGCHPLDPVATSGWTRTYSTATLTGSTTEVHTGLGDGDVHIEGNNIDLVQSHHCDASGALLVDGWTGTFPPPWIFGPPLEGTSVYSEPRMVLASLATIEAGGTWSYDYINEHQSDDGSFYAVATQGNYYAGGIETINTPAGSFEAHLVINEFTLDLTPFGFGSVDVISELFFVPGIGLVQEQTFDPSSGSIALYRELTAYTGLTPR